MEILLWYLFIGLCISIPGSILLSCFGDEADSTEFAQREFYWTLLWPVRVSMAIAAGVAYLFRKR